VVALVGDQEITDTTAAIITPAAQPSATATAGPIAVPPSRPGIFDQPFFLLAVIAAIFLALAAITSLAVGALDSKNRKVGRVSRRLEEVSLIGEPIGQPLDQRQETALGESAVVRRTVSFADRVAASRDTTGIARKLEGANVSLRPGEWVVVHALIAVLAGLLATLFSGFNIWIALLAVASGLILPWTYLGRLARKRQRQFYASMPDAMQMLAGSLSAGYSLPQALENVAKESGGAFGQEVNRALLESRLGLPIEESLEAVAQRMESKDFHWVVMAIRINRQVGGNLAEVLSNVSKTLRERERLRRQVKTLSAEGVLSAWILGALPVLLLIYMVTVRPTYILPMFDAVAGWIAAAIGLVLFAIGVIWMRNLVKMEV
jgi:tight adherence protein B